MSDNCDHTYDEDGICSSCGECYTQEIERLRERIKNLGTDLYRKIVTITRQRKRIEELEEAYYHMAHTIGGVTGYIITTEQIRAAWKILSNWGEDYADGVIARAVSSSLEAAMKELGVVGCQGCEGLGHYQEIERHEWVDCPECNGEGWVIAMTNRQHTTDNHQKASLNGSGLPIDPDVTTLGDDNCAIEPVYATLHFYHDDPNSMERMQVCLEAPDVLCSIDCFARWLRNEIKYSQEQHPDLDRTWNMLFKCFEEHGVKVPGWE